MRVLIIGSGGREHALAWKIAQSDEVEKIYAIPGNPGISEIGECVNIQVSDIKKIVEFAKDKGIDLTVVGPEAPLVAGIKDAFEEAGLNLFGPDKSSAKLEGSKSFAKTLMKELGVPTAEFEVFEDPEEAKEFVKKAGVPIVIKADGLAGGKGVVVAKTYEEAFNAIDRIMVERVFGDSGKKVVIEEFLEGEEASYMVISDGEKYVPLATSKDHKQVFDGNKGPNTGGMGAYSPSTAITPQIEREIREKIIGRILEGMKRKGLTFTGVLYAGLMLTKEGPKVLEFNVRFGDPEVQAILRRLKSDLAQVLYSVAVGKGVKDLEWKEEASVCVVLASKGYPGKYETGKEITGLNEKFDEDVVIFHAGTKKVGDKILTAGGRVLNVTAIGKSLEEARTKVYESIKKIHFEGMHYRKDIGIIPKS
jgi:phosphoribosylamine--glycine ligase